MTRQQSDSQTVPFWYVKGRRCSNIDVHTLQEGAENENMKDSCLGGGFDADGEFKRFQHVSGHMATQWNIPRVHNLTLLPARRQTHKTIRKGSHA